MHQDKTSLHGRMDLKASAVAIGEGDGNLKDSERRHGRELKQVCYTSIGNWEAHYPAYIQRDMTYLH